MRASDASATNRRITIQGVNFGAIGTGANAGQITLTDPRALQSRTFTGLATAAQLANVNTGGIVSWSDRRIVLQVPAVQLTFAAGPKQMMIRRQGGASALSTVNGITRSRARRQRRDRLQPTGRQGRRPDPRRQ